MGLPPATGPPRLTWKTGQLEGCRGLGGKTRAGIGGLVVNGRGADPQVLPGPVWPPRQSDITVTRQERLLSTQTRHLGSQSLDSLPIHLPLEGPREG